MPKGLYTVFLSAAGSLVVECVLGDVGYMRHQVNLADILWWGLQCYKFFFFFFFFCSHLDRAEKFKTFYKARYLHEQLEQYIVVNSTGGVEHSQDFTSRGRWFNPSFCICMCVHLCIHTLEIFQGGKRRNWFSQYCLPLATSLLQVISLTYYSLQHFGTGVKLVGRGDYSA